MSCLDWIDGKKCVEKLLARDTRTSNVCLDTTPEAPEWMAILLSVAAAAEDAAVAPELFLPVATLLIWNTLARKPRAASSEMLSHDGVDCSIVAVPFLAPPPDPLPPLLRLILGGGVSTAAVWLLGSTLPVAEDGALSEWLDLSKIESKDLRRKSISVLVLAFRSL